MGLLARERRQDGDDGEEGGRELMLGLPSIAIYAIGAALLFGAGAWSGHKVTSNAWKAEQLEVERKAAEQYRADVDSLNEKVAKHESEKERLRTLALANRKVVDRVVEKPVYRDTVCWDDDGLRAIRAIGAEPLADPGKPPDGLPARP
jgi:hypothetical protein